MVSVPTFWQRNISLVRNYYPEWDSPLPVEDKNGWSSLNLPIDQEADYRYTVHAYNNGERQFGASRLQATENEHFWYCPYEPFGDLSRLEDGFLNDLQTLLAHDTRIRQRNGLMNT